MKAFFFFIVLISINLTAQSHLYYLNSHNNHYKGIKLTKDQKIKFRMIGINHCEAFNTIKNNHENKVSRLKIRNSEEHYNLNRLYYLKTDSLESAFENEIAEYLNDDQRKSYLQKLEKNRKDKENTTDYRF
ncbi:hypothetical protein [Epilithonimonas sp. UC225_85]|uniref:hypothetical protein n=1 Tax=Epilithonimonas sp. UC225_85 TaxID=3350167 RepID=UPI0036D28C07